MIVLVVGMRFPSEHRDRLVEVLKDDARESLRSEPGCLRFDLLHDVSDANVIRFCEVYSDKAVYKAHREMPHFRPWLEASEGVDIEILDWWECSNTYPEDGDWR